MNIRLLLFGAVLGLQSAWILGTTYVQERVLRSGQVICLETRPVDPRDLIRGDFVMLNYKISDLDRGLFRPPLSQTLEAGRTVWVALEPQGRFYVPVQASLQRIQPTGQQVVLKGKVENLWGDATTRPVHVIYGLEQYFVREGTGTPHGKLTVNVAVPASGQASIKEVFLDGRPYAEAMKNERR